MSAFRPRLQLETHLVTNQPPPFEDVNLFASDLALQEALVHAGGGAHREQLSAFGRRTGSAEVAEWAMQANRNPSQLKTFDRYHSEPPRISRDLLIRGIGYRLQEIEHGGLGKSTRRKLQTLAKLFRTTGRVGPDSGFSLKPGARLVREWHNHTHTVTVTEDGFEYAGMSYPSLTKVAKKITGAHWSGPRFFGLMPSGAPRPSNGDGNG